MDILGTFVSDLFYGGLLQNATLANIVSRPRVMKIQTFLTKKYKVSGSLMLMTVHDKEHKNVTESRYNFGNLAKALDLAKAMIAIEVVRSEEITFYRAQLKLYHMALSLLGEQGSDMSKIKARTVDSMQGSQAPLIILDLVVTDKLGFLRNKNRLNVACSRGMDGLIIIGDTRSIFKQPIYKIT